MTWFIVNYYVTLSVNDHEEAAGEADEIVEAIEAIVGEGHVRRSAVYPEEAPTQPDEDGQ